MSALPMARSSGLRLTLGGGEVGGEEAYAPQSAWERGRRVVVVDLRGRPRGSAVLRISGRTARGRIVRRVRTFHTCGRAR